MKQLQQCQMESEKVRADAENYGIFERNSHNL